MRELALRDLTGEDINQLFQFCVATKDSKEVIRTVLFQKKYGFSEDSRPIYFDKAVIEKLKPQLEFTLGQLKDVHEDYPSTTTETIKDRYDDAEWTKNSTVLMAYLHMILAADLVKPVEAATGELEFTSEIIPTFHSDDPNLRDWLLNEKEKFLTKVYGPEKADE